MTRAAGLRTRVAGRLGSPTLSATVLRAAIRYGPRDARLQVRLGAELAEAGRWNDAADAYAAAVALDGERAPWHFRLGWVREQARQWDAAADAYAAALALDGGNAQWHYRLGRAHQRAGRWAAAAESYRAAIALDDSVDVWRERLAHVLGLMGDAEGLRRTAADIADRAGDLTPAERRLLVDDPLRFGVRRRLLVFTAAHIDEIRRGVADHRPVSPEAAPRVWMYWGQGIGHAPAMVRRCHAALLHHHGPDQVMVLDDGTVDDYVDIPGYVRDGTRGDRTKFSDVLRIDLLARHGGVWLDATCLVRSDVIALLPELLTAGFFAPRYRRTRIASWFMASDPGGHVITALRSAQLAYWRYHAEAIDYYVLHHLFEALALCDPTVAACCERMPMLPASDLSQFARAMLEPYDPERFRQLIDGAPVHKLTYKRLQRGLDVSDTMVSHLLRDEEVATAHSDSTP